jgi:hypothetical protein
MHFLQAFPTNLEAILLHLARTISAFEGHVLHIPPSLCFFTVDANPDRLARQAFLFVLAPLHAFVLMPLADLVWGRCDPEPRSPALVRCCGWFGLLLVTFWVAILIVRILVECIVERGLMEWVEPQCSLRLGIYPRRQYGVVASLGVIVGFCVCSVMRHLAQLTMSVRECGGHLPSGVVSGAAPGENGVRTTTFSSGSLVSLIRLVITVKEEH